MARKPERFLFVLEEAGGARFILPALASLAAESRIVAVGAARDVLPAGLLPRLTAVPATEGELKALLGGADDNRIVIGTSLETGLCKQAMRLCGAVGKPFLSFVDHWTLFAERYSLLTGGRIQSRLCFVPERIAVIDARAAAAAQGAGLAGARLVEVGHPGLEVAASAVKTRAAEAKAWRAKHDLLTTRVIGFVSERFRDDFPRDSPLYQGFDEFEVLDLLLSTLAHLTGPPFVVLLKTHPSEPPGKYAATAAAAEVPVRQLQEQDPQLFLAICDVVVGMSSMLLIEAAVSGGLAISLQPARRHSDAFVGNLAGLTVPCFDRADLASALAKTEGLVAGQLFAGSAARLRRFLESE